MRMGLSTLASALPEGSLVASRTTVGANANAMVVTQGT
jgi:hypothetical protein